MNKLKITSAKYTFNSESDFRFTRAMVQNIIDELNNHTVSGNGHNNDDVLTLIANLEAKLENNNYEAV